MSLFSTDDNDYGFDVADLVDGDAGSSSSLFSKIGNAAKGTARTGAKGLLYGGAGILGVTAAVVGGIVKCSNNMRKSLVYSAAAPVVTTVSRMMMPQSGYGMNDPASVVLGSYGQAARNSGNRGLSLG